MIRALEQQVHVLLNSCCADGEEEVNQHIRCLSQQFRECRQRIELQCDARDQTPARPDDRAVDAPSMHFIPGAHGECVSRRWTSDEQSAKFANEVRRLKYF